MNEKPEKIRLILAQNIKIRREYLGLSQEKLAESTGLSVQTINTIEGCRMWVSDKTITRLAKALKTEIFQLFVPYRENKHELLVAESAAIYENERKLNVSSPASILLELRNNLMSDVEKLNTQIDYRFNEAFKNPLHYNHENETET